jgi:hypothetical protein
MSLEVSTPILEEFLHSVLEAPFTRDPDGDYVITFGGARFYARLQNETRTIVQIFSVVAADLPPTSELYVYLNDLNANLENVRAFHILNQVLFEAEIKVEGLNIDSFSFACEYVALASDDFGPELVETFGGKPRWESNKQLNYKHGTFS